MSKPTVPNIPDPPQNHVRESSAATCGRMQFSVEQTALQLGVRPAVVATEPMSADYMRGRLDGLLEVRRALYEKAQAGDMTAIKEYLDCYEESQPEVKLGK